MAEAREARQRQAKREDLWACSGVDKRHAVADTAALMRCRPWAAMVHRAWNLILDGAPVLAFLGDRGNGKTQAAALIIRKATHELHPCLYLRCREVGMAVRATYRPESQVGEREALLRFVEPWLLVLDECQEKFGTDHEQQILTLLLDVRYGAMCPTILIANTTEQGLCAMMGPAVVDRMREGGGTLVFDWPSFRKETP